MKIGVMLRDIGNQKDAPGILILNLMDKLLELDRRNEYVLFYHNSIFLDRYEGYLNVKSVNVPVPTKFLWDQLAIPIVAHRENVDLIFHPKHSLPLMTGRRTLMHLRGADVWAYPEYFDWADGLYLRFFIPLFCKKATHLIVESMSVKRELQHYMDISDEKMSLIYLSQNDKFKVIRNQSILNKVKKKYLLPDKYILTVTRVVQGKKFYPGKNIINIIEAYRKSETRKKSKLVIIGRETNKFISELLVKSDDLRNDIVVLDFVPQEDLPSIYNLAKLFLFPSYYESFGIPILESMSCGCPVITSNTYSCPEIAGDAAVLVDPHSVADVATAMDKLAYNESLRSFLRLKGLKRARQFSWEKSARETLDVFSYIEAETCSY